MKMPLKNEKNYQKLYDYERKTQPGRQHAAKTFSNVCFSLVSTWAAHGSDGFSNFDGFGNCVVVIMNL